jgi:hypothetical protein
MRRTKRVLIGASMAGLTLTGAAALGQRADLSGLTQLEPGRWEVRMRDPALPSEQICIRDGRQLIQLRHRRQTCERFVVADEPNDVTVHYTCRGNGYGRTKVHRVSDRLVEIDTQGIAGGLPFNFVAEGRWLGATCGNGSATPEQTDADVARAR